MEILKIYHNNEQRYTYYQFYQLQVFGHKTHLLLSTNDYQAILYTGNVIQNYFYYEVVSFKNIDF